MMTRIAISAQRSRRNICQPRTSFNLDTVRVHHIATRSVVHGGAQHGFEVLNETTAKPYVERLHTMTDRQDRFSQVECVLQKQLIDRCSTGIGGSAFRNPGFAVPLRVNVETAAWQQDTLCFCEEVSDPVLTFVQWDNHWLSTSRS